jgi:hypothetical protein
VRRIDTLFFVFRRNDALNGWMYGWMGGHDDGANHMFGSSVYIFYSIFYIHTTSTSGNTPTRSNITHHCDFCLLCTHKTGTTLFKGTYRYSDQGIRIELK